MKNLIIYTSLTGNTKTFVDYLVENTNSEVDIINDFTVDIDNYNKIAIGTYSWGDGKIPRKMKEFLIQNRYKFKDKEIFIFGSGNSIYPNFCGGSNGVEKIVKDCGAKIINHFKFEQRFIYEHLTKEEVNELNSMISKWNS